MTVEETQFESLDAAESPGVPSKRIDGWMGLVGVFVLGAVLGWLRLPPPARERIWAEDGQYFLTDSAAHSIGSALFLPYQGYLHFVPRVWADIITAIIPPGGYAIALTIASCITAAGVASAVFFLARDIVPWWFARAFLALIPVLVPAAPLEVLGNLANLHWFLLWLTPWLLLYLPRTRAGMWGWGAVALAVALTEIQVALFAPFGLFFIRQKRGWVIRAAFLAGVLAQLATTLLFPRLTPGQIGFGWGKTLLGYGMNAVAGLWTNDPGVAVHLLLHGGKLVLLLAAIPFAMAAGYAVVRGTTLQRLAAIALAYGSIAVCSVGLLLNPDPSLNYGKFDLAAWSNFGFARYGFLGGAFLLAGVPLAAAIAWQRGKRIVAVACVIAVIVLCAISFFPGDVSRSEGAPWPDDSAFQSECATDPNVTVTTMTAPAPWSATFSCAFLKSKIPGAE